MHDCRVENDLEQMKRDGAAKLARAELETRQRAEAEAGERREKDDADVRLAVGRYRHRTLRRVLFALTVPGLAVFAIALILVTTDFVGPIGVVGVFIGLGWLFGGLYVWNAAWIWRATRSAMEGERRWLASPPFEVVGYFEWLARSSSDDATLSLDIRGPQVHARRNDLLLLLAAVHPAVRSDPDATKHGGSRFVIDDIPGGDGDQRARVFHEVVDRVLVPFHRESSIAHVTVER